MAETSLARMFWNRVEKSALRPAQQLKQHKGWTTLTWREVTIPIYPSYPPDLIQYIVNDAGVKTLIAEDPIQLAKVLEVEASMPNLEQIVIIHGYEGRE